MAGQTVSDIVDHISAISFNSTGWNDVKANLINTMLHSLGIHICAIQEHFKLDKNILHSMTYLRFPLLKALINYT